MLIRLSTVSVPLLRSLNEVGVPVTTVELDLFKNYSWPERHSTNPPFHGYLLVLGPVEVEANLTETIAFLKMKDVVNQRQPWIIGVVGDLCLSRVIRLFDEGDQILVIGNSIADGFNYLLRNSSRCSSDSDITYSDVPKIWSLYSTGNGSMHFKQLSTWSENTLNWTEPVFDSPFRNFHGRILKISSLGSPPIRMKPCPGKHKWRGYIFRVINTLAEVYNFTYEVKEADNRLYGMGQEDGTWTGMIGELTRKAVDIGAGDISWTLDRSMVIDLTVPVFPETVSFIYRAPAFYTRTWILFQDIDFRVWISLTSAMIAGCGVYFLTLSMNEICQNEQKLEENGEIFITAAVYSISSFYRALLGKGVLHIPEAISCRVVLGTWIVGSLVFSALYGGSLTSKLSQHRSPKPADTLLDLLKRYPDAILAMRNNSQVHSFFKESKFWHKVWARNMEKFVIPGKLQIADAMAKVHKQEKRSPIYVWIADRSMLVKMMHSYSDDPFVCDLYVAKEVILKADWSLALVRNSPFLKQFNEMIDRMSRFGLLEKWRREHWESGQGNCRPSDGFNTMELAAISFTDTQAIFFVLALGWVAGILTLIVERRL